MEFNEKLLELRKAKGLTQEELAESLYVSRTAVSKWESGRGYPNIDSLKAISRFFGVTIDELLSGDELLTIAEEDHKHREQKLCDAVFGLLDCSAAMLLFLPFFGQQEQQTVQAVSLLSLSLIASYVKFSYCLIVSGTVISGLFLLALQNCKKSGLNHIQNRISLLLNVIGTLLFIISSQPYAATLLFVFLTIKAFLLIKWK